MKRIFVAAAVALTLGFVSAGKADAQIMYGYNVSPSGNGIVTNRTLVTPTYGQTYSNFYSPFTGIQQTQVFTRGAFGQTSGMSYGYNPWTGMGYNRGFAQPNVFNRWGGYGYNNFNFGRRW